MRAKILLSTLLIVALFAGCSSDNGGTTDPPGPTPLVAKLSTVAPSMVNVDDTVWASAGAMTVSMTRGSFSPPLVRDSRTAVMKAPTEVTMKAIRYNDTLYLKLMWIDSTFSIWPDSWRVNSLSSGTPVWVNDSDLVGEDQVMVMFSGLAGNTLDVWYWRALTTSIRELAANTTISGFGEGIRISDTTIITDTTAVLTELALRNGPTSFLRPTYIHRDGAIFNGAFLYEEDIIMYNPPAPDTLWALGQRVPGYRIDSTFAESWRATLLLSRWDIRSLAEWSAGTQQYNLVLCRPMNTSYNDDLVLVAGDTVAVQIGITDSKEFNLAQGSQGQSFSGSFNLVP